MSKQYLEYFKQVKQEVKKIEFPSRKEITTTLLIICGVGAFFALFFLLIDGLILKTIQMILGVGG